MEVKPTRRPCLSLVAQLLDVLDAHKGTGYEKIAAVQIAKTLLLLPDLDAVQDTDPATNPTA